MNTEQRPVCRLEIKGHDCMYKKGVIKYIYDAHVDGVNS